MRYCRGLLIVSVCAMLSLAGCRESADKVVVPQDAKKALGWFNASYCRNPKADAFDLGMLAQVARLESQDTVREAICTVIQEGDRADPLTLAAVSMAGFFRSKESLAALHSRLAADDGFRGPQDSVRTEIFLSFSRRGEPLTLEEGVHLLKQSGDPKVRAMGVAMAFEDADFYARALMDLDEAVRAAVFYKRLHYGWARQLARQWLREHLPELQDVAPGSPRVRRLDIEECIDYLEQSYGLEITPGLSRSEVLTRANRVLAVVEPGGSSAK